MGLTTYEWSAVTLSFPAKLHLQFNFTVVVALVFIRSASDSGAISDSMGIVHGGGRTSTKAAMYLKQMATMSYARMIGIFIVLERLDTLRRRV